VLPSLLITDAADVVWADGQDGSLNRLPNASILIEGERIAWIGPATQLPTLPRMKLPTIDAAGKTVAPGFIDSHTHLVFAGSREEEFEARVKGASYQQIAAEGGGIQSTVKLVRQASKSELMQLTRSRLDRLLSHGVTTVEVKSGYGLSLADELKCLEVIADLNAEGPLELVPTFLGAHSIPPEYSTNREAYIRHLVDEILPEVARTRLADFCDVFCEEGVFSLEESERILRQAKELGLGLKLHANELSPLGGAELAGKLGAISADHLLCISGAGIEAMAKSGTIATLLPGTAFFLALQPAPARKLLAAGVRVALATDCNPGTCPTENLPLIGTMACVQMKMTPAEVLAGLTVIAAAAVGQADRLGTLRPGMQADLAILKVPNFQHMLYHFGANHVWRVIKRGRVVYSA